MIWRLGSEAQQGRSRLGRGPKFPHSEPRSNSVLNLGLRLQTREIEGTGLKEGFRIRKVVVWACARKEGALAGFCWACVKKGRALAGERDRPICSW